MAQQIINRGSAPNDGTGDTGYVGTGKINANFTELYSAASLRSVLYAADYGVVANTGISQDVAMGLAAAAASAAGAKLVLPPGTITLDGTGATHITLNGCWMEGSGGTSGLLNTPQGTTFNLTSTSVTPFYLEANWKVSNCNFYWPNQTDGVTVYPPLFSDGGTGATQMRHGVFDNITVINAYDVLSITSGLGTADVKISNCTMWCCHYLFNLRNTGDAWVLTNCRFTPGPWLSIANFSAAIIAAVNAGAAVNAMFHCMSGGSVTISVSNIQNFAWRYAILLDAAGAMGNSSFNWTLDGTGTIVDSSSGGSYALQNTITGIATTCGIVTYAGGGGVSIGGKTNAFVLGAGSGLKLENFRIDACTGDFIDAAGSNSILINNLNLAAIGTVADGGEYYFLNASSTGHVFRMYDSTIVGKTGGADAHEHGINYSTATPMASGNFILKDNFFNFMSDILTMQTNNNLIIQGNASFNTFGAGSTLNLTGSGKMIYDSNSWDLAPTALLVPLMTTQMSSTGSVKFSSLTVSQLAAAATANKGAHAFVTDATATMTAGIGSIVAGGGANGLPVFSDGTNWRIG